MAENSLCRRYEIWSMSELLSEINSSDVHHLSDLYLYIYPFNWNRAPCQCTVGATRTLFIWLSSFLAPQVPLCVHLKDLFSPIIFSPQPRPISLRHCSSSTLFHFLRKRIMTPPPHPPPPPHIWFSKTVQLIWLFYRVDRSSERTAWCSKFPGFIIIVMTRKYCPFFLFIYLFLHMN